ncbi:MAG TPA: hypothetical protein VGQ95_08765 [Chthoniobacterales bacterium]|nr:hypothetical protein [Chthoniobacterales bacterium]
MPSSARLNSISQEAFIADHAHVDERTMHAGRQKFFAQSGERGRARATEQVRRDREIELIDQAALEERAKKCWAAMRSAVIMAALLLPSMGDKHDRARAKVLMTLTVLARTNK